MSDQSIGKYIRRVAAGNSLSEVEARSLFAALDADSSIGRLNDRDARTEIRYALVAIALMAKGPTTAELAGIVEDIAARSLDLRPWFDGFGPLVDISGTGGDLLDTPNVGSLASFVSAAGGVPVAKQATRAFTGISGSADVFRLLGLDVMDANTERAIDLLRTVGVTAMHTPSHSGAFTRRMAALRYMRELGIRIVTPWHLVSWIYSPFPLTGCVYGVCDDTYRRRIAGILQRHRPTQRALVVHGVDGIDEISVTGPTMITEICGERQIDFRVYPDSLGLTSFSAQEVSIYAPADFERLQSCHLDSTEHAEIKMRAEEAFDEQVFAILGGNGRPGHEALVAANAGAALYVGGKVDSLAAGTSMALELLRNGAAQATARAFAEACDNTYAMERLGSAQGRDPLATCC
jgi:anthranilate phosphoribosyltransferase